MKAAEPALEESLILEAALLARLRLLGRSITAYSGGVDSAYLAAIAHEVLGQDSVLVIADSASIPRREFSAACELAHSRGWNLVVIQTDELANEAYRANAGDRCYHCKSTLFAALRAEAARRGITQLLYGAITDDLNDHRPGAKAAAEARIQAPLQEGGLSKAHIRLLSARRGLPTAAKAAMPCLASRIPRGHSVSLAKLSQVEAAEEILRQADFSDCRARHHGELLRIEVPPAEITRFLDPALRVSLEAQLRTLGFRYICIDLAGYRSGSSN